MDQDAKSDTLTELLCFNTYALNRAFGRFYQAAFSETGLTYPKFVILMVLDAEGVLSVSELSSRASVEANTLSPLLKKMAGFGVITRQRAEADERRVEVGITPLGKQLLDRARTVVTQGFEELGLGFNEVQTAIRFLEEARARVDQASPPKLRIDDITG